MTKQTKITKRGRGRPKGSLDRKKNDAENKRNQDLPGSLVGVFGSLAANASKNAPGRPPKAPTPASFKEGNPGGPGRPSGSRNQVTLNVEQIGEDNVYQSLDVVVEKMKNGCDSSARYLIEMVYKPRKGSRLFLEYEGPLESLEDINQASAQITRKMMDGVISPEEAFDCGKVLEQRAKRIEEASVMRELMETYRKVDQIRDGK